MFAFHRINKRVPAPFIVPPFVFSAVVRFEVPPQRFDRYLVVLKFVVMFFAELSIEVFRPRGRLYPSREPAAPAIGCVVIRPANVQKVYLLIEPFRGCVPYQHVTQLVVCPGLDAVLVLFDDDR